MTDLEVEQHARRCVAIQRECGRHERAILELTGASAIAALGQALAELERAQDEIERHLAQQDSARRWAARWKAFARELWRERVALENVRRE